MNLNKIPKVELHLHLDCSISYEAVKEMDPGISREYFNRNFISPVKCKNLGEYIKGASEGISLMQTEKNIRIVIDDLFDQLKKDNVIYAEIRFAPFLHTNNGLKAKDVVKIVEESVSRSVSEYQIEARIILCTLRHFQEEQSLATAKLVKKFKNTRVAGFDLAGNESGFPIKNHIPAFQYAKDNSILCTAHAGEAQGPESIYETIENPAVVRIGHGVRCIEDPDLMKIIREREIHLEVCPTSNVQSNVFHEYKDHPIKKLFDYGILLGINTDARTLSNITLSDEYNKLNNIFGFTENDFYNFNLNALKAAFLPERVKQDLISKLNTEMQTS